MEPRSRPIGISILAVLHIVGGLIGSILIAVIMTKVIGNPEAEEGIRSIGIPPGILFAGVAFLCILIVVSGIGMWRGLRWGWYFGSFYYVYSVVRNATALVTIPMIMNAMPADEVASMSRGPGFFYMKHGGRIVIHLLIFMYFFKNNVREYFGLAHQAKWKPALAELLVCIGIAIVINVAARVLQ